MTKADDAEWLTAMKAHLENTTGSSREKLATISEARHAFQSAIAEAATPALNNALQAGDDGTLETRRTLCSWVNEQLRSLNLAVRCPKTGAPSILVVDARDQDDERGRFRLEHPNEAGRAVRSFSSVNLPVFELMENPQRSEPFAGRRSRPSGRGR